MFVSMVRDVFAGSPEVAGMQVSHLLVGGGGSSVTGGVPMTSSIVQVCVCVCVGWVGGCVCVCVCVEGRMKMCGRVSLCAQHSTVCRISPQLECS